MTLNMKLNSIPNNSVSNNFRKSLRTLILFEQYSDERTIREESVNELSQIGEMTDPCNETRPSNVAL